MSWTRACALSDLADETALAVTIDGEEVCLARSEGRVYALRDECSHAEFPLSRGEVANGTIECWLHGSRFCLATGKPSGLPATRPVRTYRVQVADGDVLVEVPAGLRSAGSRRSLGRL
jgi:3-phenylpropionate/trans-cinnamate dioxygenase ferredoxin subunit